MKNSKVRANLVKMILSTYTFSTHVIPPCKKRLHHIFTAISFYFIAIMILPVFSLNGYSISFEGITTHDLMSVENLRLTKIADWTTLTNTSNQNTTNLFLTYENPVYGVKIEYPASWQAKAQDTSTSATADKNIVVTFAPQQQQRSPRLFLQVERLNSQNISLDQFTSERLTYLGQLFGNCSRIIEQGRITLPPGDIPAHRAVYEFKLSQIDYKKMDIWTIKDGFAFTISYIAEKWSYDNSLPTIQKMIESFEISYNKVSK